MFILDINDKNPLYKQLYRQIREHVLSGKLSADSRLPSVRTLVDELSTSRNTVDTAYQELYAEGYIYSKPRSGYFVSGLDQDAAPLSLPQKPRICYRLPVPQRRYDYDFHPARLDPESFPAPLWRRLFVETLRESFRQLVQYGEPQGEWGLRPHGNIIYCGTFSKILSPALRVSFMVLQHALIAAYRELFQDYFSSVPHLDQRTLVKFMEQGHWDRHVRRMRTIYKKKHDTLLRAVAHHFGDRADIIGQGAGLHVVLQLSVNAPGETEIINRALKKGIRLFPFTATHATGEPVSTMLMIGFGGMPAGKIEPGIGLLSQVCY